MCRHKLTPKTTFKFLTSTLDSRTKNDDKPYHNLTIFRSY